LLEDLAGHDTAIRCAACNAEITRSRWACSPCGAHRHRQTNPAGITFDLRCFSRAPGLMAIGRGVPQDSWFPGMAWRAGICVACGIQLGWDFRGQHAPFVALIENRIRSD